MERFWGVLQVVLPVAAILLCGVLIRRKRLVTDAGMGQIKAVLVNICLPAVLFRTFYAMDFTWRETAAFFTMSAVTLAAFGLGFVLCRLLGIRQRIAPWLCTTIEGGSIGYALFILLHGQSNLYHLALLDAGNALIQWSLVMTTLAMGGGQRKPLGQTLKSLVTPINIAIVAGLVCSATGLGRGISATGSGQTLEAVLDFIGTPVGAMIMMSVGFDLSFRGLQWAETLKAALARALIFGALGVVVYLLMGRIFPDAPLYRAAALVFFILPPTYAYSVYTRDSAESAFLGGYLAVYTLFTVASFTVIAAVAG